MKKVYLVSTTWWENDRRYSSILRVFDNKKAAEGYLNYKKAHMSPEQKMERTCYYLDTEALLSKNPMENIN